MAEKVIKLEEESHPLYKVVYGKVGITPKGAFDPATLYDKLTIVTYKGQSYLSLRKTQGVDPETDVAMTDWLLLAERGESLYQMFVRTHRFEGTEKEFLDIYQKRLNDALAAANAANKAADLAKEKAAAANAAASEALARAKAAGEAAARADSSSAAANTAAASALEAQTQALDAERKALAAQGAAETAARETLIVKDATVEATRATEEATRNANDAMQRFSEAEDARATEETKRVQEHATLKDNAEKATADANEAAANANAASALCIETNGTVTASEEQRKANEEGRTTAENARAEEHATLKEASVSATNAATAAAEHAETAATTIDDKINPVVENDKLQDEKLRTLEGKTENVFPPTNNSKINSQIIELYTTDREVNSIRRIDKVDLKDGTFQFAVVLWKKGGGNISTGKIKQKIPPINPLVIDYNDGHLTYIIVNWDNVPVTEELVELKEPVTDNVYNIDCNKSINSYLKNHAFKKYIQDSGKFSLKEIKDYSGGIELPKYPKSGWWTYDNEFHERDGVYCYNIKANKPEGTKIYFTANQAIIPFKSRNIGIYDEEDNLIYQTFLNGTFELVLKDGYTAYITASDKAFEECNPVYLEEQITENTINISNLTKEISYDIDTPLTPYETRNGYYINSKGIIQGDGVFPGFAIDLYKVFANDEIKIKGECRGSITVAQAYKDQELTNPVQRWGISSGNIAFSVYEKIKVPATVTVIAVCRNTGYLDEGVALYQYQYGGSRIERIEKKINTKKEIVDWGDSLTAGAGGDGTSYSSVLQDLLGSSYKVINAGVGGETTYTIAARQGGIPMCLKESCTIPSDRNGIQIQLTNFFKKVISPLKQGGQIMINPCYIDGIEGEITKDSSDKYFFKRSQEGSQRVVRAKEPIITNYAKNHGSPYANVFWIGSNGEFEDTQDLINQYKAMINFASSRRYVIIGMHYVNDDSINRHNTLEERIEQENAFEKEFGLRFINWREYLITNALADAGIKATEGDRVDISAGKCPRSLLSDSVHFNATGYTLLGKAIFNRFKILGYVV